MEARIQAINVEIGKFKEFINKFHLLFEKENFNYNLLESQFGQQTLRNERLKAENDKAEIKIKDSLDAAEKIVADAREHERQIKTSATVLYHKIQGKYRQIEDSLSKSEKKQVETHLKELETMAV